MDNLSRRKNLNTLITLAIPVIMEEILTMLLQYVDMAMVGRLGAAATASVSLTETVNWLIGNIFASIGVATVAIISSSYGAGDFDKIKKVSNQVVLYVLVSGLFVGALAVGLSPVIPVWMQADVSIREQASMYFRIISIPIVFRAATIICASALRAVKDTRTPMLVNLLSNILNVILNYILIYKVALGVKGAAISTAISSVLCGLAMFALMMKNSNLRTPVRLKVEKPILKETVIIGFPVMATTMVSCFGHVVFASLVSSMGTTVFAAHSIALSAETIFYLPGYGLRSATSTLIGISVGENSYDKFKTVVRQSVLLTVGMMAFTGLVLFITASQIMAIFSPDEEVIALGARVLRLVAISEPIFGLMIVSEGIYYGMGQTKTAFIVTTIGSWGIRIVSTVICVYVLHTGLFEIWICMLADNTFRALAMAIPLFSGGAKRHFYKRRREFEISC